MEYTLLHDVRDAFFISRPQAKLGKKIIDTYLIKEDYWGLAEILRHHDEEWGFISNKETWDRDSIDYFIESFSLIAVIHLAVPDKGFIPSDIKYEIEYYLGDKIIRKYYSKNYPLLLPQLLYDSVTLKQGFKRSGKISGEENEYFYNKFCHLNNFLSTEEIDDFLWLLDGGWKKIDMNDFNKIISSAQGITNLFKDANKKQERKVFFGFVRFLHFLNEFNSLLILMEGEEFLQSVYWHYFGYWFDRSKIHMRKTIRLFFKGIKAAKIGSKNKDQITSYILSVSKMEAQYLAAWDNLCVRTLYGRPLEEYYKALHQSM